MKIEKSQSQVLKRSIQSCGHFDRQRFSRRFSRINSDNGGDRSAKFRQLKKEVEQSLESMALRAEKCPQTQFGHELPIHSHLDDIATQLKGHQVVIICGETGSGKTTQIPQLCLQEGYGIKGLIGHTQPRRIAAKSIATRLSHELGSSLGKEVGYTIRHSNKTTRNSYIKVMTDGVLLAELQRDRLLNAYDVLIIDEAHERSLNIDFILGYLKQLIEKRPELRVIVTSATIDVERFSAHFKDAPIIEVSGRTYPVDVRYRPIDEDDTDEAVNERALLAAIEELSLENRGDILVFLDGERDIQIMMAFLRKQKMTDTDILPLYGRLGSAGQAKVFKAHKKRHVILATNVAETSLTITGIAHVIDFGTARISRYSYRSKVQRLPIEKISQASANQRKGRCGRTEKGICIRLYSEENFQQRPVYTEPEIQRTNLASVILQMKSLGLDDIADFPFIDPPNQRYINDGLRLLNELAAIDDDKELSPIGKQLARLPVDPRLARMLLAANDWNCVNEVLIIVSGLSIQDPRERPLDNALKADESHSQFFHKQSDFMSLLKLWDFYQNHKKDLSQNRLRKCCKQNYLSYNRLGEWHDVYRQLSELVDDMNFIRKEEAADYNNIHGALLTGLLSHIAFKSDEKHYVGARSVKLHIFPGSSQFKTLPKWIMAAELGETSKLYARMVASIDPKWLLKPARHLLKRTYSGPHWDNKKQHISAYETVTLYGLTIVTNQVISYGRVNHEEARKLFITEGLVNLQLDTNAKFYKHHCQLINEIKELERKARRLDILDDEAIYDFYDQRLPKSVHSLQTLDGWRKDSERSDAKILFLDKEIIMQHAAENVSMEAYPDVHQINQLRLPLQYEFIPGEQNDGVTIEVPLIVLNQMESFHFEGLIPGLLEEKITYLLKSLPKQLRRQFVPVPGVAKDCAKNISIENETFLVNLTEYLFRTRGVKVPMNSWRPEQLPDHLFMNIAVLDESGKCIEQGRDIQELKNRLAHKASREFSSLDHWDIEQNNIVSWDFPDLPTEIKVEIDSVSITAYPAFVDEHETVSIKVFDNKKKADKSMLSGLRRLYLLQLKKEIKSLKKQLPDLKKLTLHASKLYKPEVLFNEVIVTVVDKLFIDEYEITRRKDGFDEILQRGKGRLFSEANELCRLLNVIFKSFHEVNVRLDVATSLAWTKSISDIKSQLSMLIKPGFIESIPGKWLLQLPRYLDALKKRLDKLEHSLQKDQRNTILINKFWQDFLELYKMNNTSDNFLAEMEHYRWMLEEYRVSLFAQELKTIMTVSPEKLQEQLNKIRKSSKFNES